MRASSARKLCTLSSFLSPHLKNNPQKTLPSIEISLLSETQHHLHADSPSEDLPDIDVDSTQLSSILNTPSVKKLVYDKADDDDEEKEKIIVAAPKLDSGDVSIKRKEVARERKHRWNFKDTTNDRFDRLVKMSTRKLGATTAVDMFGRLGGETGLKEYNRLIRLCIEKARSTYDEYVSIEELSRAFNLFKIMRECGLQINEQTYHPVLHYIIDMGLVQEFQLFSDFIQAGNPNSIARLGYYEMMLWISVNDEEMIRDICEYITVEESKSTSALRENYLLALCKSDRKTQILDVLKNVDITKFTSEISLSTIFQSLGRLLVESDAESLLLDLRACDYDAEKISNFIATYVVSIPNLAVEDVISKVKNFHDVLEVLPSSSSYEKLITYCCGMHKVEVALDIVDKICESGFTLSSHVLQSILQICEETCDYILVHQIYSIISRHHHHLELNGEICRSLVNFCVRIKDFERAFKMVDQLQEMNFKPTSHMYNAIMTGYFREKNISGGRKVLKHMQDANVKPDSHTFSYLIGTCETEDDINMYYEEMKQSSIQLTKQIFMALINAYAACGEWEKAKQVVLDPDILTKNLNEIKCALVAALASHGQLSEALAFYKEIKKDGHNLEPKAVISLIEELRHIPGELEGLLLLLKELNDLDAWVDGCFRVIQYCVKNNLLSSTVDLFKQLKDSLESDETVTEVLFDAVYSLIAGSETANLQFGLDLLWAIKDELGLVPSRQCLDFLLSACASAGDLNNARLIWREYEVAGYPYNVLSYVRMYQALLASGDHRSADFLLKKIPQDDAEVCSVILACQKTYRRKVKSVEVEKKKKKKKGSKKKKSKS